MKGYGLRQYVGTGPWLAFLYGTWNALVLALWAFAVTAGAVLAWRTFT